MTKFTQTSAQDGYVHGYPVEGPITSLFGATDIAAHAQGHSGLDIGAPSGSPIRAPSAATVREVFVIGVGDDTWEQTFGNSVILDDGEHVQLFGHMMSAPVVQEGQRVEAGTVLGYVGSTGNSTGPHLHWGLAPSSNPRLLRGQGLLDPLSLIGEEDAPAPQPDPAPPADAPPAVPPYADTRQSLLTQVAFGEGCVILPEGYGETERDYDIWPIFGAPHGVLPAGTRVRRYTVLAPDPPVDLQPV